MLQDKKNIRLLMMIDSFAFGGTETYVLSVVKELIRQGIHVYIAGKDGPLRWAFLELGCPVFTIKERNLYKLESWIRKNRIHLINSHLKSSGKKGAYLSQKIGLPFVHTVHFYCSETIDQIYQLNHQTKFIAVSVPLQKWLSAQHHNSILIPNGISTSTFHPTPSDWKERLGIPPSSSILLYASRLEGKKAKIAKRLIEAVQEKTFREFPDLHVIIAGDGKRYNQIHKLIATSYSKQIHMIGFTYEMPSLYSISDLVIGTGRVALEAMSCERPVIAIGTAGSFGIVKPSNYDKAWQDYFGDHGGSKKYSRNSIHRMIVRVLSSDVRYAWGQKNRRYVKRNFHISKIAQQLMEAYQFVLQNF